MNVLADTLEETAAVEETDDLTPEQRAYWEASIERDMRDIAEGKPKKYITLDEFEKKLMDAVHKLYA